MDGRVGLPEHGNIVAALSSGLTRVPNSSECSFDARSRRILNKTDFSYFCSIAAPEAGPEELRTVCDWGNWVFPFDDSEF